MKLSSSLLRITAWSFILSVIIRIVYGLHAVYGAPVLIIPLLCGFFAALFSALPYNAGFAFISIIHMILMTSFAVLFDYTGLFRGLAYDSAMFFVKNTDIDPVRVNVFWSILFVSVVYFISYVLISAIASRVREKKIVRMAEDEESSEDIADEDVLC